MDTVFIRYALIKGLPKLLSLTSGSVFPNISANDLKGFELPWPEAPDREAVASLLHALDDKIESNWHAITLMDQLARAHFEKLLYDS